MSKGRIALEKLHLKTSIEMLQKLIKRWQIKKLEKTAKVLERNVTIFDEAEDFGSQAWHVQQQKKQNCYIKFKI